MADGFAAIERQAVEDYGQGEVGFEHFLDMRYIGQEHTVKIAVARGADGAIDIDATRESFHSPHEKRFTYRLPTALEIVHFHLVATVAVSMPDLAAKPVTGLAKIGRPSCRERVGQYV